MVDESRQGNGLVDMLEIRNKITGLHRHRASRARRKIATESDYSSIAEKGRVQIA
jgi:hypothetical protein